MADWIMPATLEAYDRVLHDAPVHSVQMAQRLLAAVRRDVESGQHSRQEAYEKLLELYDFYEGHNQVEELEAVADVLDSFDRWSPLKAVI
jgi:DNA-binding transcriptional regulator YbjK